MTLRATGRGRLEPATISADAFRDGIAIVHVRYDAAEAVQIAAASVDGARTGTSGQVLFEGGAVARFDVAAPPEARAGVPFEVQVWAYDAGGNLVRAADERGIRAKLRGLGDAPVDAPPVLSRDFRNGVATVRTAARLAGALVLEVRDEASGAVGRSREIRVHPGPVALLEVAAPATARAGEPFAVEVVARDAYGNVVADHDRTGDGVRLRAAGAGRLAPAEVPAGQFVEGRARVLVAYDRAEEIRIAAEAEGGAPRGLSAPIDVRAGAAARFDVEAPAEVFAGEPFPLTVVARDRYGNVVADHAASGGDVEVLSTGLGPVEPGRIPAGAFRAGVAEVTATCRVAETIRLRVRASGAGGAVEGLSNDLAVRPGPPAGLRVVPPGDLRAGEAAPLRLEIRDRHGNLVTDLDAAAISLAIRAEGFRLDVGDVPVFPFRGGVTIVEVIPRTAGEGRIVIEEAVTRLAGAAEGIRVRPGPLDRFEVVLPSAIRAGEPARIGLLALDAVGNVVTDYDGGARLEATGAGRLTPEVLAPALFEAGRAEAYILYDRAEAVSIRAVPAPPGFAPSEVAAVAVISRPAGARVAILATAPVRAEVERVEDLLRVRIPGARLGAAVRPEREGIGPVASVAVGREGADVVVAIRVPRALPHRLVAERNLLVVEIGGEYAGVLPAAPAAPARARQEERPPPGPPERPGGDVRGLIEAGDLAGARRRLEQRLAADPSDAEAAEMLRRIEILERVGVGGRHRGEAAPVAPPGPGIDEGWERIERMVRDGRYEEALGALAEHERRRPGDERAGRMRRRLERLIEVLR